MVMRIAIDLGTEEIIRALRSRYVKWCGGGLGQEVRDWCEMITKVLVK